VETDHKPLVKPFGERFSKSSTSVQTIQTEIDVIQLWYRWHPGEPNICGWSYIKTGRESGTTETSTNWPCV